MSPRLGLGNREAIAQSSWGWLRAGTVVRGHEFHRSECLPGSGHPGLFRWQEQQEGLLQGSIAASYLHHHWGDRSADLAAWLGDLRKADEGI